MDRRERYRFGSFTLDANERQLTRGEERLTLAPKTFDLLLALARRAGRLVTKRDLMGEVWPDAFVEEGILAVHVSTLRKVLNDPSDDVPSIETVARSGYRFRRDVIRLPEASVTSREHKFRPQLDGRTLAVLPFVNLSPDSENEYFSDGLTDEIIHALAQIPHLKVIARTSAFAFKNRTEDIRQIGHALNVGHVLEGSVRRSRERMRVTVQLIRVGDGTHLWSERYERHVSDVFSMQDEIAEAIRAALLPTLTRAQMIREHEPNATAYEAFLKGVWYLNKMTPDSMLRAREYLEEAIAADAAFVQGRCTLAMYYIVLAANNHRAAREVMPLARASAERALQVDASNAEAHSVLGQVAALFDFDWKRAEREQALATARDPVSPSVRIGYARHLMLTGRAPDGAEHARRMLDEDPLNLMGRLFLAHCLQAAGNEAAAAVQIRQVLDLDERFWLAYLLHGLNQIAQGLFDSASASAARAYELAPWNLRVVGLRAGTLMRAGETSKAEALLRQLNPATVYGVPAARMVFHQVCGELEEGATWAQQALEQRDTVAAIHLLGPDRKTWSSSSRWPNLARTMNLPASVFTMWY